MENHPHFMKFARSAPSAFLAILLFGSILPGGASAQTRTATSPLDRPAETSPTPPSTITPNTPPTSSAVVVPPPNRIALPTVVVQAAPVDRATLLPEGVASASGLTEEQVVARIEDQGIAARRARARVESSEAAERVARRGFVPHASATARYTRLSDYTPGAIPFFDTAGCVSDIPNCQANPNAFYQNVVLQQPILNQYALIGSVAIPLSDYVGTTRHELVAARAETEAARAQARATLDDVRLSARDSYWEVVRARAQHRLAEDSAAIESRRLEETRERRTSGLATDADLQQAEATARAYAQLVEVASTRVEVAERTLRDLLSLDEGTPLQIAVDLEHMPTMASFDSETARTQASRTAPSVVAARRTADASRARVGTERARMMPSVSATFNYQYMNPNSRIFPQTTEFTGTWDAGVQAQWSLDGTLLAQGRMAQRRALAESDELAAEEAEQQAGQAAIAARGAWLSALANVEAREAATASAQTNARNLSERRGAGIATETQLRDADAAYLRARLDLVDAIVEVHHAHSRYVSALGEMPSGAASTDSAPAASPTAEETP